MKRQSMIGSLAASAAAAVVAGALIAGCTDSARKTATAGAGSTVLAAGKVVTPLALDDQPAKDFWGAFPENADPKIIGRKVVQNLLDRPRMEAREYGVIYPEVCAAYGALRLSGTLHDQVLLNNLVTRYEGMLNPPGGHAPPANSGRGRGGFGGPPTTQGGFGAGGFRRPGAGGPTTQGSGPGQFAQGGGPGQFGQGGGRGRGRGRTTGPSTGPTSFPARNLLPKDGTSTNMIPVADHVDHSVFGVLPLEIYRQIGDRRYLEIGKKSADDQWKTLNEYGLTSQARYWVDDMFMIIGLQCEAYRDTNDPVYIDRAAKAVAGYLDYMQQPNGLFFHTDNVEFYWSRGDGWFAVGMAEVLNDLPANHPLRPKIMAGYQKMMAGLLKYQNADGMWHNLIDHPESFAETSGTGMFVYAMARGVRKGWLDAKTYKEPVRKAWIALTGYVNKDGNVTEVCGGTSAPTQREPDWLKYYLNRPRNVGDLHGQAAFLWASWAMVD